jgi:hypothetical protein
MGDPALHPKPLFLTEGAVALNNQPFQHKAHIEIASGPAAERL